MDFKNTKSSELHEDIIQVISEHQPTFHVRDILSEKYKQELPYNLVAWGLVELQNTSRKRGRNQDKNGPIIKTDKGYVIR